MRLSILQLAAALAHNRTLQSLDLTGNNIGLAGAEILASGVALNGTLTNLNLRSNRRIGAAGAVALGLALTQRPESADAVSFTLDLSNCNLGFVGVEALMDLVRHLKPLPTLRTDGNFMKEELVNSISHGFGILFSLCAGVPFSHQASNCTAVHGH